MLPIQVIMKGRVLQSTCALVEDASTALCAPGGAPLDWPQMLAHLPDASQELATSEHTRWTFITQARACGTLPYKKKMVHLQCSPAYMAVQA